MFSPPQPVEQQQLVSTPSQQFHQMKQMTPAASPSPKPEQGVVFQQLFRENVSVDGENYSMDFLLGSSPQKSDKDLFNSPVEPQTHTVSQNALNEYMNQQLLTSNASSTNYSIQSHKSFKCELCENSYSKSDSLKRHMITHSGKFKCPTCEQGFTEQRRLDIHVRDKENCKKLLMKRGQTFVSRPQYNDQPHEPYPNSTSMAPDQNMEFSGNIFQSQQKQFELPEGLQIRKKSQTSNLGNDFGYFLNPNLKQKLVSNPDLSIQVKNEPKQ